MLQCRNAPLGTTLPSLLAAHILLRELNPFCFNGKRDYHFMPLGEDWPALHLALECRHVPWYLCTGAFSEDQQTPHYGDIVWLGNWSHAPCIHMWHVSWILYLCATLHTLTLQKKTSTHTAEYHWYTQKKGHYPGLPESPTSEWRQGIWLCVRTIFI